MRSAVDLGSVNLPVDSGLSSFPDDETSRFKFEGGLPAEDEKSIKTPPPVDVGEILRRWTHVLQAVHKQAVRLVCIYCLSHLAPNLSARVPFFRPHLHIIKSFLAL